MIDVASFVLRNVNVFQAAFFKLLTFSQMCLVVGRSVCLYGGGGVTDSVSLLSMYSEIK